jgi:two-component system OmpR family sensor kinase
MKAFRSISWRLQFWYGLLLAAVLIGLGVTAFRLERARLERAVDDELHQRVSQLLRSLHRGPPRRPPPDESDGPPPPPPEELAPNLTPGSGPPGWLEGTDGRKFYYAVWLLNGPRLTLSPGTPPGLPRPTGGQEGLRQRGEWREAYFSPAPQDWVLVGCSTAADDAALRRFAGILLGVGAAVLALGLLGGGWLVTRALQPIQDISAAAAKISRGDLSQRIGVDETAGELGELAGVLNACFARLEEAFARQARFTGDAAHELRTPVTVILTHAENGLAAEGLTEEQREAFAACRRAAQRMRSLIESLLQLARLDSGENPVARARCDLAEVARGCLEFVQPMAQERGIALHADLAAAECVGDPRRLEQVVTNLLVNALHYNRDGGEVRLGTRREGNQVVLEVGDTGIGIAAEHLPQVFDRFYRVDQARTAPAGRTGLGLAIVKAVVDAHGGTIEVASRLGEGTTFTVRLPAI